MLLTQKPSDTFCHEDFFSESELAIFESAIQDNLPFHPQIADAGPFAGKMVAEYTDLMSSTAAVDLLLARVTPLFDRPIQIAWFNCVDLHCPWDIHSDYYLEKCPPGTLPYYSLLIPMDDVPSRTIIFNQYTDSYTDFYVYKQHHSPVADPVDEEFWAQNLSMCWPEDRLYVNIKSVMPWQRRGQLQAFNRKYFHSSDNFHTRFSGPKRFVNARLNTNAGTDPI